jgi:hypothetical protein
MRGVADYLDNGNVLGYFSLKRGHGTGSSRVMEIGRGGGGSELVFDAVVYARDRTALDDYRATRRTLYSPADDGFSALEPPRDFVSPKAKGLARK